VPTIDLPADELDAIIAAIRSVIESDKFPHAPRLDPLRAALARLEAATPAPHAKAPPAAKGDKRRGDRGGHDMLAVAGYAQATSSFSANRRMTSL
jgi:hypothetical protein